MPWLNIDDGFHTHPRVIEAGNAAAGLFVRLASYCSQHLTDGEIPGAVPRMYGSPADVKRLLSTGLIVADGKSYRIPDYLDYNLSAAQVRAGRAKTADRQRAYRERVSRTVSNAVTDAVSNSAHSTPLHSTSSYSCTESSVRTAVAAPTDDDDFSTAIDAIVAAKEARNPPTSNPEQWRRVVRANTIAEDGNVVKALLDGRKTVDQIVRQFTMSEAIGVLVGRHPDDCQTCDQGLVEVVDNDGVTRYQPCSERIVAS